RAWSASCAAACLPRSCCIQPASARSIAAADRIIASKKGPLSSKTPQSIRSKSISRRKPAHRNEENGVLHPIGPFCIRLLGPNKSNLHQRQSERTVCVEHL